MLHFYSTSFKYFSSKKEDELEMHLGSDDLVKI